MVNEVFSDTEAYINSFVKAVRLLTALLVTLLFIPVPGEAQSRITPCNLAVKTNLAYDALGAPSLGMEIEVGKRWSVAATAAYKWGGTWAWKDQVHITTADISLNYWTKKTDRAVWQGLHVGPYVALYRYDFLFGSKGEQAKINWGAGVTCGYSLPVSRYFSFDFVIGLGYVGGKYKKYEVSDDSYRHNVWTADKVRHYVGPTKLEVSLVWHVCGGCPKMQRGGSR